MHDKKDYKEILTREGLKSTKQRNAILAILEQANNPLSAEEIFIALKEKQTSVWLSTVYRTLETLTAKNVLVKSTIIGDDKGRYELNRNEHKHHIYCVGCHKMIPVSDCPVDGFEQLLKDKLDFDVTGHKLEIYGYCQDCKLKK